MKSPGRAEKGGGGRQAGRGREAWEHLQGRGAQPGQGNGGVLGGLLHPADSRFPPHHSSCPARTTGASATKWPGPGPDSSSAACTRPLRPGPRPGPAPGQPLPTVGLGHGCLRHFGSDARAAAPLPPPPAETEPRGEPVGRAKAENTRRPRETSRPGHREWGCGGRGSVCVVEGGGGGTSTSRRQESAPAHAAPPTSPGPSGSGLQVYANAPARQRFSFSPKQSARARRL